MAQEVKYVRVVYGGESIPADRAAVPVAVFGSDGEPLEVGGGGSYTLPSADVDTLGGVKVSVANLDNMNAVDTYINQGVVKGRVPNAGASTPGLVRQAAAVADASTAPTQEDFNGLLASLRSAGILAAS